MEPNRLYVNGNVLCTGVRQATSRSEEPVLCLIKGDAITFVALSGLRMVISWKNELPKPAPSSQVFVIPPLIADLLACDAICAQVGVEFAARGGNVVARLTDHLGTYELRWASDVSTFPAPEAFSQLVQMPEALVEVPHLRFSDAVHQAVAHLGRMEAEEQVNPAKLAILIDLDFGRLRVEGEEIVTTASHQFYFDPRLVIRALEFLKEKVLRVGITPVPLGHRGYLSLVSEQDGWTVHCSLLSIGMETQKLYPLPPGRNR